MDKIKFNGLSEINKVNCILELSKKNSLNEISTLLGIKKNSIKSLMEKYNYTFNGKNFLKHKEVLKSPKTSMAQPSSPADRLYALEMRIFELETITRNINCDLQNHKQNHQNNNPTLPTTSSSQKKIVLKDSIIDTLNIFLKKHPDLSEDDVINKAISEYIENYHRLVIYNKKTI